MFRPNLFDDLLTIHRKFDDMFNRSIDTANTTSSANDVKWVPPFECYVKEKQLAVRLYLPGVDEKSVSVSLTDNVLAIHGERPELETTKEQKVLLSEVPYGRFERRISLPADMLIDTEKCAAKFEHGVLEIMIPIVAEYTQTRQIPIQMGSEQKQLA